MRAVQFSELGAPEVMRFVDAPEPHAGPGQLRIRVAAAGVNPVDWKIRSGASRRPVPIALPSIPGMDAAGTVDEVGEGRADFAVGDEVFGPTVTGAYAEFALLEIAARKPATMSWAEAGGLPSAVETATRALNELGVLAGETLFISGAAGGVGLAAVQLARERGVRVIGSASADNQYFLHAFGAEPVVYGADLVARVRAIARDGVSRALDVTGHGVIPDLIELTGSKTTVMTLADAAGFDLGVEFSTGSRGRAFEGLHVAASLFEEGRFTLPATNTFTLDQAPEAHRLSETGHIRGKIVMML
jgi:NADPH:quinone reductase-like Zn-dependent oxidoreductase